MNGISRLREREGGYATGYAVIAGGLCLSLLVTVPMAAAPLARLFAVAITLIGL